jgi:FkbM family methyltransferase
MNADADRFFAQRIAPRLFAGGSFAPAPLDRGVVVYGAGELGRLAIDYFETSGIEVLGVLDQSKTGELPGRMGTYRISALSQGRRRWGSATPVAIAVATAPSAPIQNSLWRAGWASAVPFYALTGTPSTGHPLRSGWTMGSVSDAEALRVQAICQQWADAASLAHYESFVAWHSDFTELMPVDAPITPTQRYALRELLAFLRARHRQFVDVGSHLGESVQRLSQAGVTFQDYVLFEPDDRSRAALAATVAGCLPADRRVVVQASVLGDRERSVPYAEGLGYCSQVWAGGASAKRMQRLDDLDLAPDLLKVHTEGTEGAVLAGAARTIERYRPALAFSVYHDRNGLSDIIHDAMSRHAGYRWYFRMHSFQGTGAFVYGIPHEALPELP